MFLHPTHQTSYCKRSMIDCSRILNISRSQAYSVPTVVASRATFKPSRPVLRRTQGIEFVGVEHDVLLAAIFVALDDGGGIDGAMHRAVLGVANALAAVGMKLMEVTDFAAGYGRVRLDRRVDQAELQES